MLFLCLLKTLVMLVNIKNIVVLETHHLKKFDIKYFNINLSNFKFTSKSKQYANKFIKIEEKYPSDLIEIHNRPNYLSDIVKTLGKKNLSFIFSLMTLLL